MQAARFGQSEASLGGFPIFSIIAVGHEMMGDNTFRSGKLTNAVQVFCGLTSPGLVAYYNSGTENDYQKILDRVPNIFEAFNIDIDTSGNSMQDLRLTKLGFEFGKMIEEGVFQTNEDVAAWLRGNLMKKRGR